MVFSAAYGTHRAPFSEGPGPAPRKNLLDGATLSGSVDLPPFGVLALADPAGR